MFKSIIMLTSFVLFAASTANAIEAVGGSARVDFSAFTGDTSFRRLGFEGSVELEFSPFLNAQIDLGHNRAAYTGANATNFGAHAIYNFDAYNSFGAFVTRENTLGQHMTFYGLEFGVETGSIEYEGYFGRVNATRDDMNAFGVSARYLMINGLGITGSYAEVDRLGVTRTSVKLDRELTRDVNLFVEAGIGKIDTYGVNESSPFVGIGGKVNFGRERGTTFEQRSLSRMIPGF
tara:strand:- start:144 stop:845 length:702 start_codon:yes stop_codon:yes gene_type:complete